MPMPATGLLQLYLWQGRMRVENLPAYIRRQMSRHPALTAALTPRLGACPGQTILVLRSRGLWQPPNPWSERLPTLIRLLAELEIKLAIPPDQRIPEVGNR